MNHPVFWYIYSAYNLVMCAVFSVLMVKGVLHEKPGKVRMQKFCFVLIALPMIIYAIIAVYIMYPLGLGEVFDFWKGFVCIIALFLGLYIYMAFRDGTMGLRLSKETYNWTSDMALINKGAEYTNHMLKNQTAKMEWCLENLKVQYESSMETSPEELAILSRSIETLKNYTDMARKYTETIRLSEELCNLKALLDSSLPSGMATIEIDVSDDIYWVCDKTHMTEVFTNILANAIEASNGSSTIEICCEYDKKEGFYFLSFKDHGAGMSGDDVAQMFNPYFTTKNTERNFGLGLAYCRNAVEKHSGHISAESRLKEGTIVTIAFPAKKAAMSGNINGTERNDE